MGKSNKKKIAIIGVGLIGGSLGLALKKTKRYRVTGIGRDMRKLRCARKCGSVDEIYDDFKKGVKNADIIVFASPVMTYSKIAEKIKPFIKNDAVIFDVGSTKLEVTERLWRIFNKNFVGAHPIAGAEKSGVKYARADLFKNTVCVLTPVSGTDTKAVKTVKDLMENAGAKVIKMAPSEHDRLLALTSHLPHIVAISLVLLLGPAKDEKPFIKFLIGSGFRDTTRISAGSPEMWIDICRTNRENIIDECGKMINSISGIRELLQKEDWAKLSDEFEKAKKLRDAIKNGTNKN